MKKLTYILFAAVLFMSCEEQINPELDNASNLLTIDAFINNKPGAQNIYITRSLPYFEQAFPAKVSGAEVFIEDVVDGTLYEFIENDSAYTYVSADTLGTIGHVYRLVVRHAEEEYESFSDLGRVPAIDSLKFTYQPPDAFIDTEYYFAEFVARDLIGPGDTYWIKTFKNGAFLEEIGQLNVAYDAAFSPGSNIDGQVFIQPIQNAINPFDTDDNDEFVSPYLPGDSLYVEIHSISLPTFFFFQELNTQANRPTGFGALFAEPLANVPTNIENTNPDSEERATGFFTMSAVSGLGIQFTDELAAEAKKVYEEENQ